MVCSRCHRALPEGALFCPACGKRQGSGAKRPPRKLARRSPGSGNVHRLPGNRAKPYAARVRGRVIGTYATQGEAVVALQDFVARGRPLEAHTTTFAQVYEAWSTIHYSTVGDKTAKGYTSAFEAAAELHSRRMRDLRTGDYQQVIDRLVAAGRSYSLCAKQQGLFAQLSAYAMQRDLIEKDYSAYVRLPKKPDPKSRVLSTQEQAALWQAAETEGPLQETARIGVVLLCTGMRIGELLQLPAADVHLAEGYAVGGEKTTAGRGRVIPLPAAIHPILQEWLARGTSLLIASEAGGKLDASTVRHRFARLMASLGIEGVSPRTCRHTCATVMAAAGVPPRAIQSILGHASYSTTADIYTHPGAVMLVNAAAKVEWRSGTDVAQTARGTA